MSRAHCPLTGATGIALRRREPTELASAYGGYFGKPLPPGIVSKYFTEPIQEYFCESSGLRWFQPALLGEGDYYSALAATYPWYYSPASWDKDRTIEMLGRLKVKTVLEVGCGDGAFLARMWSHGLVAQGIDINPDAVARARAQGREAYLPETAPESDAGVECLCLHQTIEHVTQPTSFLLAHLEKWRPRYVILSAPCFDSLLAHTSDPLVWPPHHATLWSQKALGVLASQAGLRLVEAAYDRPSFSDLEFRLEAEGRRKLPGLPYIPKGRLGRLVFRVSQVAAFPWAVRYHSIHALMTQA